MKLFQVQVLRGLAALLVVLFHAQSVCPGLVGSSSASAAVMGRFGSYGVDLFFVLSGFIIRYAEPADGYEPRAFLWRRVCRVLPVYWLLTLVAVALGFVFVRTSGTPAPDLLLAAKSLGFVSFSTGRQPLLYVGWSLEFEMFFYLATAAFLVASRSPWRAVTVGFSLLSALGSALVLAHVEALRELREFFLDPLLLEFALGVLLGHAFRTRALDRVAAFAVALGFVATLVARWDSYGGRVVVAGLPAALLLWIALVGERRGSFRAPRALVELGDASYSIYLLQVFTLSAFAKAGRFVFGTTNADLLVVFATLGTVLAAWAFHRLVEAPLVRLVQRAGARLRSAPALDVTSASSRLPGSSLAGAPGNRRIR